MKYTKEDFRRLMSCVLCSEDLDAMEEALDKLGMGFFEAPASTKYHGAYKGGLFDHSYEVTEALLELTERLGLQWDDPRSPYIVGMLHDLCKCDNYMVRQGGEYLYRDDLVLTGHGDKSVILAQQVMASIGVCLTEEELLCIRWHMGAFDDKENWGPYGRACEKYPNVLYTHTADMIASKVRGI